MSSLLTSLSELSLIILIAFVLVKMLGSRLLGNIILGAILGGLVGFMHRPSVPALGQLPFDTVVTRGEAARFDTLVRPTAEQSFNYLVIGAIMGAVVFGGCAIASGKPLTHRSWDGAAVAFETPQSGSTAATPAQTVISRFCTNCGTKLGDQWTFCGFCGTRRGVAALGDQQTIARP